MRRLIFAALAVWLADGSVAGIDQDARRPHAIVAEYDGIIHPVAAEFIEEAVTRADTSGAAILVLVLRTPGGLLDSTRAIVSRMIAARTPVAVFVAPSGARAASAGFIIALAADVAAMAPGTHIGAAHPVSGSGEYGLGYFLLAVEEVLEDAPADWEGGMRITSALRYAPAPTLDEPWARATLAALAEPRARA